MRSIWVIAHDMVTGQQSGTGEIIGAILGGAASGAVLGATGNPFNIDFGQAKLRRI